MMGNSSNSEATHKTPIKARPTAGPKSPAIPSDFEDIPMSPIALSAEAASTDFGSTPTKSYAAFPRTPQANIAAAVLEAPSSRLRHSITMRKALSAQGSVVGNDENNLSFDMGDVEMMTSAENLNQLTATPFAKTGQANYVTLKEQEKVK
jgi:hypothetical protein